MLDQEIRDIWNSTDDSIKIDIPLLVANLNNKMKETDRTLLFRDAREIIAAIVVMIFYGWDVYSEDLVVPRLASISVIIWCMYIIYRMLGVRKYKKISELSNSVKAQLAQQKMYLQQQAHLLDTALSWYIGPFALIITASIVWRSYSEGFDWSIVASLVILFLVSAGIYLLNKYAAKGFQPLIDNIDNVLIQLDENNEVI